MLSRAIMRPPIPYRQASTNALNLLRLKELQNLKIKQTKLEKKKTKRTQYSKKVVLNPSDDSSDSTKSSKNKGYFKQRQFPIQVALPEQSQVDTQIPDEPEFPMGLDIAVVGRPNAGKSSLLNRLLDFKVT